MRLSDFDYELPEAAIALYPPAIRGGSRLLVLGRASGQYTDSLYSQLAEYLQAGDVMVLNTTRVIKARLMAATGSGAKRELLLLERHGQFNPHELRVVYRRHLRQGQVLRVGAAAVTVREIHGDGTATVASDTDLLELAQQYGSVPLPPYMHRQAEAADIERYQTIFAQEPGSVAAPTASLNLTEEILESVRRKGVQVVTLTLHVGLGTFMPIRTDDITEHVMHKEYFSIPAETIAAIRQAKTLGHRVVAVGTTVTRTLEYAAAEVASANGRGLQGEADIFIYPGYKFKVVDALLTNFHAPKSTVLMMAAAFAGWPQLKAAYKHAIASGYKLLSYGDSMFIC